MGLFSFLFHHLCKQRAFSEPSVPTQMTADPHETVPDATISMPHLPSVDFREDDADDLIDAISTAVLEKNSDPIATADTVTETIEDSFAEEEPELSESVSEKDSSQAGEITIQAEADSPLAAPEEWGSRLPETMAPQSYHNTSIPLFDDEKLRLVWKLKGTGKKRRQRVIRECVKDQPVFVICNSNGSNCTIITEEGEELGRLSDQDSAVYHTLVAGNPHNLYIKKIRSDNDEKPTVKILVIVREGREAKT
jgi:hypothetical protein